MILSWNVMRLIFRDFSRLFQLNFNFLEVIIVFIILKKYRPLVLTVVLVTPLDVPICFKKFNFSRFYPVLKIATMTLYSIGIIKRL